MYYYIVDTSKITQRQFDRVQQQLYSSISDYKINGEIVRTTGIRTIKQLVETAFFHQAKTIVAVGTDDTLNELINIVADRPMVIGFIPLIDTEMGEAFGLNGIPNACKALGMRRLEEIDLGVVNGMNFLSQLSFGTVLKSQAFDFLGMNLATRLARENTIKVSFNAEGYHAEAEILNGAIINCQNHKCADNFGKPTDGMLDLVLVPKLTRGEIMRHKKNILDGCFEKLPNCSIMHLDNLEITNPGLSLKIGEIEIAQTPARIEIKPKALKLIVGRERKF